MKEQLATATGFGPSSLLEPTIIWCLIALAGFERGRRRLRRHSPMMAVSKGRIAAWWGGVALVVVAIGSPLDVAAGELFSFHMVQHLLLALVAPLLFVASAPALVLRWSLPEATRRRVGAVIGRHRIAWRTAPAVALTVVAIQVLALASWHVPAAYDAAERSDVVHALEHVSFVITGLALWSVVLPERHRAAHPRAIIWLFLAGLPMGAIAALLTLAPRPLYESHLLTTAAWGLTPLEDQQLAGAVMWVPGGLIHLTAAASILVLWLREGTTRVAAPPMTVGGRT